MYMVLYERCERAGHENEGDDSAHTVKNSGERKRQISEMGVLEKEVSIRRGNKQECQPVRSRQETGKPFVSDRREGTGRDARDHV
jgi:hypothetical protein